MTSRTIALEEIEVCVCASTEVIIAVDGRRNDH